MRPKITLQEAKSWLASAECVRCKEIHSGLIYDAMPWEEDAVIVRQVTPEPVEFYIMSYDVFADKFGAVGD
jgi:hypothetical protein